MLKPPIPPDEAERLALLQACHILYTPAEEAFDDVARLAAELCGTEIALITLVDSERQWFKARVGVDRTETPRDLSFCGHCINTPHPLIVEDALRDPRFADNPLVTGDPFIRFYAGVPLEVDEGSSVGALSVADRAPRALSARELESLRRLARQISRELRLRMAGPSREERAPAIGARRPSGSPRTRAGSSGTGAPIRCGRRPSVPSRARRSSRRRAPSSLAASRRGTRRRTHVRSPARRCRTCPRGPRRASRAILGTTR